MLKTTATRIHGTGLGDIKIAGSVRLQVEYELVKAFRRGVAVAKVLVVIGLAVVVQVVVPRELVPAGRVNDIVHDLETEGFVHTGGEALPREIFQFVVDARDYPDVAVPGAERGAFAIGKKVQSTESHAAFPRILNRWR